VSADGCFHESGVAFPKRLYASTEDLQDDLDLWVKSYYEERPHQGRWCFGKTPLQTFLDAIPIARQKMIAA
jgi:hypothetical protein